MRDICSKGNRAEKKLNLTMTALVIILSDVLKYAFVAGDSIKMRIRLTATNYIVILSDVMIYAISVQDPRHSPLPRLSFGKTALFFVLVFVRINRERLGSVSKNSRVSPAARTASPKINREASCGAVCSSTRRRFGFPCVWSVVRRFGRFGFVFGGRSVCALPLSVLFRAGEAGRKGGAAPGRFFPGVEPEAFRRST